LKFAIQREHLSDMEQREQESIVKQADEPLAPQLDVITALFLVALGIGVAIESWRMPRFEHLDINPYTVPGLVPGLLGSVLACLGMILLIRGIWKGGWRFEFGIEWFGGIFRKPEASQLGLTLLLTAGYAGGLVGRIHFGLATFLFVSLFILLFEWRSGLDWREKRGVFRISLALAQGAVVAVAVTLVFERIFLVRLP
jgi:hypothetical protein